MVRCQFYRDLTEQPKNPTESWRSALCLCKSCTDMYYLRDLTYLTSPEELWETELDDEAAESMDQTALRRLNEMPRDRAIEAVSAYNQVKEELSEFMREAARKGKVITEEDVKAFFGVG